MHEIQLTPTSYVVLGLIAQAGEATPYELKQMADTSVGQFWSLPRSQLYAEPARLAAAGYLVEDQEEEGRRRKRYALTAAGREALAEWIQTPTSRLTEIRDLAFLKLFFGGDPASLAEAQLAVLRPLLDHYQGMLAEAAEAPAGARRTLEAGIDHVRASVDAWERIVGETTAERAGASAGRRRSPPAGATPRPAR